MNEDLFYDRTTNISGISLVDISLIDPIYGSSVTFESTNLEFNKNDNYYQLIPRGINNLSAKFNLSYQVNETKAIELVNLYENSNGSRWIGVNSDSSIYRDVSGYCESYSIDHINNQNYKFNVTINVVESPGIINWSGMNYLNPNFSEYEDGVQYEKHDIVYTGVNDLKLNNFFYCTKDHNSTAENSPTGIDSNWTQEFYWKPDLTSKNSVKMDVNKWEAGFASFNKIKKNTSLVPIDYTFSNISTKELKSILHFLENKCGYRRFKHQIPSVYNRPKVYICPTWTHTWVYKNSHNLQVSFKEDPLGVIPKDS